MQRTGKHCVAEALQMKERGGTLVVVEAVLGFLQVPKDRASVVLTLRGAPQRHWDPAFNPRVVFSPDGKRLVGTNWDESISMWDTGSQADEDAVAPWQLTRRQAANARAVFWHLQEAEDCLEHSKRSAALFHFQRLGTATLPQPLQARKERLAAQLEH